MTPTETLGTNNVVRRFRGCLPGLAAGDAVGTTVEFKARGSLCLVTDMGGGGPFGREPGQWTDDTSMAAVCDPSADAFYDQSGIPAEWPTNLCARDKITGIADRLRELGP